MNRKLYFDKKKPDCPSEVMALRELKERGKPVYIFGVQITAERVKKQLEENGIGICGYFVDNEFYHGEEKKDYPVFSFDYVMGLPEADVVLGFHRYGIAYSKIEKGELCNRESSFSFLRSRCLIMSITLGIEINSTRHMICWRMICPEVP